jgi:hypothetical protein
MLSSLEGNNWVKDDDGGSGVVENRPIGGVEMRVFALVNIYDSEIRSLFVHTAFYIK